MKKTRVLSVLLSLSMLLTQAIPGTLALPDASVETQQDSGMVIHKTATPNDQGNYTITLEAYATGDKVISEQKRDVPTDMILVLDQSGSMDEYMATYEFALYEGRNNSFLYDHRQNQSSSRNRNLYYQLDDGSYTPVSVEQKQEMTYSPTPKSWVNYKVFGDNSYWANRENLYALVNGQYQKVTVSSYWKFGDFYIYELPDGTKIAESKGNSSVPTFEGIDGNQLYLATIDPQKTVYTYIYNSEDGLNQMIEQSIGADTIPTATFYERRESGEARKVDALKSAVSTFVQNVQQKAAGQDGVLGSQDDVNHRIAVVGFASRRGNGNNTELLSIQGRNSGSVGIAYNSIKRNDLKNVLQDMNTSNGQKMVQNAIDALDAEGATEADLGMDMAQRILSANPVQESEKRSRVVIFFTDGSPTRQNKFETSVANAAIDKANAIKRGGATVYSVGIFEGADATVAGITSGSSQRENQFMQDVSSNNGTPSNPSYYLSASDSETLNSIFKQISDQIETGGSSTTLNADTVVKDIIAPSFNLPSGTKAEDITLETWRYTGKDQWEKNLNSLGATASIDGDQVSVTGFDFAEHYVGTVTENGNVTYRGNKLVISFNVEAKDGFLGGNGVYTNTNAGIFENSSANEPILEFERPKVDVPISDVAVTAPDKDVYLLQNVSIAELQNGTTANVGGVTIDLTKPAENWGLEPWQNEYVDISVEIRDKDGNVIANDLTGLTADSAYTVSVKVSPKTSGSVGEKSGKGTGNINVYKPELTFRDGEAWYGGQVPGSEQFSENLTATKWLHNGTLADTNKMSAAPELTVSYTPNDDKIQGGIIDTKQDVPVDVGVKLGEIDVRGYTTFQHTNCAGKSCQVPENYEFLLHINTCQLTITKTGGVTGEPYVFDLYRNGSKYSEITIIGNGSETIFELPVGVYSINEDTNWSWRYFGNNGTAVELTAENSTNGITCVNSKTEDQWLNGFSEVITNIFGIQN